MSAGMQRRLIAGVFVWCAAFLAASAARAQSISCTPMGGHPFVENGCLEAGDLNNALEFSIGPTPPQNASGQGALLGKPWLDTSVSPAWMRMCAVGAGNCAAYYLSSQWLNLFAVDFSNMSVDLPIGGGTARVPSATVVDLGLYPQATLSITGNATISSFGLRLPAGQSKIVLFTGTNTIVSGLINTPTGANLVTQAGAMALVTAQGNGLYSFIYSVSSGGGSGSGSAPGSANAVAFNGGGGSFAGTNVVNSGVLVTTSAGIPIEATTLPSGLTIPAAVMVSPVITGLSNPTTSDQPASKGYVDASVTAGTPHAPVSAAATTSGGQSTTLPNTPTYVNTAGPSVFASTLTASSNAILTLDGVVISSVGQRVGIFNMANSYENGIYTLTQAGVSGTTPWILTRSTDFDQAAAGSVAFGASVLVTSGATWTNTSWEMTTTGAIAIGTTAIVWTQTSAATSYTADNISLEVIGNIFSIKPGGTLPSGLTIPGYLSAGSVGSGLSLTSGVLSAVPYTADGLTLTLTGSQFSVTVGGITPTQLQSMPAKTLLGNSTTGTTTAQYLTALPSGYSVPAPVISAAASVTGSVMMSGVPSVSVTSIPSSNAFPTLSTLNVQANDSSTQERQYLVSIGFVSNNGVGLPQTGNYTGDRAALYVGAQANPGTGDLSTERLVNLVNIGASVGHHHVSEMDMNNVLQNVDATLGPGGMQYPNSSASGSLYTYGLLLSNRGTYTGSAALVVNGPVNNWVRGVGCQGGVSYSCLYDYSNSTVGLDLWGTHTAGIDFTNGAETYLMTWGAPGSNARSWLTPGGDYEFGGGADTALVVKSSSTNTPSWALQTVSSGGVQGRFRIADAVASTEPFSIAQTTGLVTVTNNLAAPQSGDTAGLQVLSNIGISASTIYEAQGFTAGSARDVMRGVLSIPAGTTVWNSTAVAGYVMNNAAWGGGSTGPAGIALMGQGVSAANNAKTWGINTVLSDNVTATASAGTNRLLINEFDYMVTSADTVVFGLAIQGAAITQPAASYGLFIGCLNINNCSKYWPYGVYTADGAAVDGLRLGRQPGTGANINSQNIILSYNNPAGAAQYANIGVLSADTLYVSGSEVMNLKVGNGSLIASGFAVGSNIGVSCPAGTFSPISAVFVLGIVTKCN